MGIAILSASVAAALLAASPVAKEEKQQPCLRDMPMDVEEEPTPKQKSGPGLWIGGIAFGASDIAEAAEAQDAISEEWGMHIRFTGTGRAKFQQAQHCGVDFQIEISFDGRPISRPILREYITGPEIQIAGLFTEDSAAALAARIAPVRSVEP